MATPTRSRPDSAKSRPTSATTHNSGSESVGTSDAVSHCRTSEAGTEIDPELAQLLELTPREQARQDAENSAREAAKRKLERDQEMRDGVTLKHDNPAIKFYPQTMAEGVKAWSDRKHVYTSVPDEMHDVVFFSGSFAKVHPGQLTLDPCSCSRGTVYIWADIQEPADGGFPQLGWDFVGVMNYAGRVQLHIWKKRLKKPEVVEIAINGAWKGGVGFMMAPDDEPTPEPSEESVYEEPVLTLMEKFFKWLEAFDPYDSLDAGLEVVRERCLVPVEALLVQKADQSRRKVIEAELETYAEANYLHHIETHPEDLHAPLDVLLPAQILEVYRRLRRRHQTSFLSRAFAGKASPRETGTGLCWRFSLGLGLLLLVFWLVSLGALTYNDVVVQTGSGALTDTDRLGTPIAAAAAVQLRPLWEYPGMSYDELRRIQDVVFVHRRATHVVRAAVLQRKRDGSVHITGTDGSALRVDRKGVGHWRPDGLGSPEERLDAMEEWRSTVAQVGDVRYLTSGMLTAQVVAAA